MAKKILALVSEAVDADTLKTAVGDEQASDAEVLVVAPSLNTKTRFLLADPDPAIERAEQVQEETVERLSEGGVDAAPAAAPGEEDPLLALQDALATYEADHVLVFVRSDDEARYREDDVVGEAERRFGVPVTEVRR
jgi:hypothetical protein